MYRIAAVIAASLAVIAGAATADAAKGGRVHTVSTPTFTDQEIIDAAYGTQKVHPGAYSENLGADESLYYVNTVSLTGQRPWIEVCTDDEAQAAAWAEATNQNGSQPRTLTGQRQNEKFFEYDYQGSPEKIRMRVHKCSYAAPSIDRYDHEATAWGTYNGSLVKNGGLEFAQYQWFVENYGRYDGSLMASVVGSGKTAAVYDLYHAYIALAAGPGQCDVIELARETVTIDKTRSVDISKQVLRTVQGNCEPAWG